MIRRAFALSLLLHALLVFGWLPVRHSKPAAEAESGDLTRSLAVRLVPPAPPPAPVVPVPMLRADPVPELRPAAPRIAAAPRAPVITTERQATAPSVPVNSPVPVEKPVPDDFAALVDARRRAREASQPSVPAALPPSAQMDSARDEHNRMVARNLGLDRPPSFGGEQQRGGGIFQLVRLGRDDAEFVFYGWNRAISRQSQQTVEVRRGTIATIELAIVRRMVQIIRDHETGDFKWESQRLGRNVTLSARPADNAGLEDFLMRDFFTGFR